jgi:hypothetical protein
MGRNSKKRLQSLKTPWLWNGICLGMPILRPYLLLGLVLSFFVLIESYFRNVK